MKITCAALLAGLLFVNGVAFARPQSTQTGGDQTKPDANATKNSQSAAKNKKNTPPGNNPSATSSSSPSSDSNATNNGASASKPTTAQKPAPPASTAGMVWVNTDTGIYHKPGTRWYGRTKQGKYMTEADAKKAGYHAAAKE